MMGVSTDGLLFFGFEVEDDDLRRLQLYDMEQYEDEDPTPEELEAREETLDPDDYIEGSPFGGFSHLAQLPQWKGLKLENVCSDECPQYCLTHDAVSFTCSRGYPEEIPLPLVVPDHVIPQMKAFCERFHIPWQEPVWMLGSYWG